MVLKGKCSLYPLVQEMCHPIDRKLPLGGLIQICMKHQVDTKGYGEGYIFKANDRDVTGLSSLGFEGTLGNPHHKRKQVWDLISTWYVSGNHTSPKIQCQNILHY